MKPVIKLQLLCDDAKVPTFAYDHAAAMDLYTIREEELLPNRPLLVPVGFAMEIPPEYFGFIRIRGGHGAKGIRIAHSGVIDPDFRGEIQVGLMYHTPAPRMMLLKKGERFAQMLILPRTQPLLMVVDKLTYTNRGEGQLNSSGKF